MPHLSIALLSVFMVVGCAAVTKLAGFPPEATRKTAPAGLEQAIDVGAVAPALQLAMSDGSTEALRGKPTVLLFYRGHW